MANRYKNLIYSTAEYTHSYSGFRGIELNASGTTTSLARLSYAQNLYKDYDGDGAEVIESIPGFRCFAHHGEKLHAIYYQRSPFGNEEHRLVHVKDKIIRHPLSDIDKTDAKGVQIATVRDQKSFGFEYGCYFYIMDAQKILQIDDNGACVTIGDSGSYPYVPTTYVSGEAYEQRNLLTRNFKEEFYIADPKEYLFSTNGLKFSVTDHNLRYCALTGIGEINESVIYVPAYVDISGISYKVMSVGERAFYGNNRISAVYLPEGMTSIGAYAFYGCVALNTVSTPSTLLRIEDYAFCGCTALRFLYLGASLNSIGTDAFKNCSQLTTVNYAMSASDLTKILGYEAVSTKNLYCNSRYEILKLCLPFHDNVEMVKTVKINGTDTVFEGISDGGYFRGVSVSFQSEKDATGVKIEVYGMLTPLKDEWSKKMNALTTSSSYEAIINCTTAEVFDGRVFLSGNPAFPNTVFYTERPRSGQDNALYVGQYNYFNDGVGSYKIKSMLAVRDMLAIFKEGDDGSGSIFYHKKESVNLGPITTVYPVAYVHCGICSLGACLSFLDDPVFLSNEGLMALSSENINYQRNVVCRSHNVNYILLKEDLSNAHLCEWSGYLAVGVNGKIFLADSRSIFTHAAGSREYEWFYLTNIGAYNGDSKVYRYSSDPQGDAIVHPTLVSKVADMESIYSVTDENGESCYYINEDDVKYSVTPTEELSGGEFFPATIFTSHGKLLFFSTADGHICVFNNDKRGVAPDEIKKAKDYDESEYLALMGNKIHPYYYSFAGHAPTYALITRLDDCGVPHLTKNTVRKSLVIKAKSATGDSISCEVKTDNRDSVHIGNFPAVSGGFANLDFSAPLWNTGRYSSVNLDEKEKRWIEKQIILSCEKFASPISVYSISYRYTIKGKIKNNV